MTDLTEREREPVALLEAPDIPINLDLDEQIVPMWKQRLRIFVHNKLAVASVLFLFITIGACVLVPIFHPTNQTDQALTFGQAWNQAPSWHHWLGTDSGGFDELGRIFYGGEYSLTLGLFAGFITIVVGTTYGMISGFAGGVTDTIMMRIIDAFLSIPYIFLLITLISIFNRSTVFLICIIGFTLWATRASFEVTHCSFATSITPSAATASVERVSGTSFAATSSRTPSATS